MPGFWLINWWTRFGPTFTIAWIVWVIASITIHELAHGLAAIRHGDRSPLNSGRMTLNPLVHMGPLSLVVFALCGVAWGVMPVSPSRMRGKYALAAVAAGQPPWILRAHPLTDHVQPAANLFRKHPKSSTFSTGGTVELSQFA